MCSPPGKLALVFLMSLLPVLEGRYAVLAGIAMGLSLWCSALASALGVIVLSILLPLALPLADRAAAWLAGRGAPLVSRLARAYLEYSGRARRRAEKYVDKYGLPGLVLFVAIPLPATGIWTGAIGAHLLGLSRGKMSLGLLAGGLLSLAITALAGGAAS